MYFRICSSGWRRAWYGFRPASSLWPALIPFRVLFLCLSKFLFFFFLYWSRFWCEGLIWGFLSRLDMVLLLPACVYRIIIFTYNSRGHFHTHIHHIRCENCCPMFSTTLQVFYRFTLFLQVNQVLSSSSGRQECVAVSEFVHTWLPEGLFNRNSDANALQFWFWVNLVKRTFLISCTWQSYIPFTVSFR